MSFAIPPPGGIAVPQKITIKLLGNRPPPQPQEEKEGPRIAVRPLSHGDRNVAQMGPQIIPQNLQHVPVANHPIVKTSVVINAQGKDGTQGSQGCVGSPGTNGAKLVYHLSLQNGVVVLSNGLDKHYVTLDPKASISINASGGKGGAGGSGKIGADSQLMTTNYAYTHTSITTKSYAESGGQGGDGGKGGDGGQVTISVDPENIDLLSLLQVNVQGGKGGEGGYGGSGGYTHNFLTPLDKIKDAWKGTKTEVTTKASSGASGRTGNEGQVGSYIIQIGNVKFTAPYNLEIASCAIEDSNQDGIIEPSDFLSLSVSVKNSGGLHAPTNTRFSVIPTTGVVVDASCVAELGFLDARSSSFLKQKLFCLTSPLSQSVGANPVIETRELKFCATTARVQKEISSITGQPLSFQVRYPVEMSAVKWSPSISIGKEALISYQVKNISTKEIGLQSGQKRTVEVVVEVDREKNGVAAKDIQFITAQRQVIQGETGSKTSVGVLLPGQAVDYSCSIQLMNGQIPLNSKVHLIASLYLGKQDEPNQKICIQKQPFSIQLA